MSAERTGPRILAIGNRDDFLHVYRNDQELISDDDIGAGMGEISGPIEFFNSHGYRLAGIYDRRWHLLRLVPTADPPQPGKVQQRVCNVVEHLRSYIRRHPDEAALYGLTVQEALDLVPRISASADLETSLSAFSGDADHGHLVMAARGDGDSQGDWHNFRHRCGWKHN